MKSDHVLPKNIQIVNDKQEVLAERCKEKNVLRLDFVDSGSTKGKLLQSKYSTNDVRKMLGWYSMFRFQICTFL